MIVDLYNESIQAFGTGFDMRKPAFGGLQTTKVQTSLNSAFVVGLLESIIPILAKSEISIF